MQAVKNCDRKGGSFRRVGAGAEFVEQYKRPFVRPGEEVDDIRHVGRECRQALLYALLIADVGVDFIEQRDAAPVRCRNMETGQGHQCEQTGRLERNCLSTGIGTCDDQQIELLSDTDIDRHDLLLADQRMSGFLDFDDPLAVDERLRSVLLNGQTCPRKYEVE